MARSRGGRNSGPIWKRLVNETTGKIAEIRLSQLGTFSCKIGDDQKDSKTAGDVEAWANKIISIVDTPVEWIPVIDVTATTDRYGMRGRGELSANVKIGADRYWIARTHTGLWRIVHDWSKLDPKSPGCLDWQDALKESQPWNTANNIENPERRFQSNASKPRPFKLPHQEREGSVIMKYDDVLWKGVARLVQLMERELEMMRELLATTEGHEHLRAVARGTAQFALEAETPSTKEEKRKRGK